MTKIEACQAIEAETHTRSWAEMTPAMRILVIKGIFEEMDAEPEQAAKKVIKQRKPRKSKTAPLTQHAMGQREHALASGEER